MVLSFKTKFDDGTATRFVEQIIGKQKIHSIREDKNKRWKVGTQIDFATGVRTKNYSNFRTGHVVSIQHFEVFGSGDEPLIYIDGNMITDEQEETLARCDGFDSVEKFLKFFPVGYVGRLIHWTNKKY